MGNAERGLGRAKVDKRWSLIGGKYGKPDQWAWAHWQRQVQVQIYMDFLCGLLPPAYQIQHKQGVTFAFSAPPIAI